jgi:hypothetical protein
MIRPLAVFALLVVDVSACSAPPAHACIPGESVACACSDGRMGAQVCMADGSGYEACVCSQPDAGRIDAGVSDAGRPIDIADEWVAGFYAGQFQGTNVYAGLDQAGRPGGYYLELRGDPGVDLYASVNDCSSFSDLLMRRAHGWVPPTTSLRPLAQDYYWAIRNGVRFMEITNVNDIQPGDVMALKYPANDANTGHVAWIDAAPQMFTGPPNEPGLTAYTVAVVDSSNAFHDGPMGPTTMDDDRYLGTLSGGRACTQDIECLDKYGANATCNSITLFTTLADGGSGPYSVCSLTGVGRGQMRLFADASGTIKGYSWSPNRYSTFNPRPDPLPITPGDVFPSNDVVVGRYTGP